MSSTTPPTPPRHSNPGWWADWRDLSKLNWGVPISAIFGNLIPTNDTQEETPMTTSPTHIVLGSANFNFGFGSTAQRDQAKRMKAKCDSLYGSEIKIDLTGNAWTGLKPREEGMWWKRDMPGNVTVGRPHARPCVIGGHKGLSARYFVRTDIHMPWGPFRRIGVHMPPARLHAELYPRYTDTLHDMINRSPHPVIVDGDWNERTAHDPAGLHAKYGGDWHGSRIDAFYVDPELRKHIGAYHEEITDARRKQDNHPDCYLTVKM